MAAQANKLSSKVSLHFQCAGLKNADTFSKNDPFVVAYARTGAPGADGKAQYAEIWRSKTTQNDNNPIWTDSALLDYHFEEVQHLRFEVFDRDSDSEKLKKHDFLGRMDTTMSKIMGSRGCTVSALLMDKKGKVGKMGKMIVRGQEQTECKDLLEFQFQAEKLARKNMGGLGRSDPFYIISQQQADQSFLKVFESEVIKSTTQPLWVKQKTLMSKICNGEQHKKLLIEVFDFESDGKHQFIGAFETSVHELQNTRTFDLRDKNKSKGRFIVNKCEVIVRHSFLEYVQGGCELKLSVAIDFTGSNGHPADERSLHYMPPDFHFSQTGDYNINSMNEYQKALVSVGQVVLDYDTDKSMGALGFGANLLQIEGGQQMNMHAFPLSLDASKPELKGIPEFIDAYRNVLNSASLSGPTYFSHLLDAAMKTADESPNQSYSILLILTDGTINDMNQTVDKLVTASNKPLSVIIVGVGSADFEAMEELDADGGLLKASNNTKALRDLVQFVPYRKFNQMGFTRLAEETLKEVPKQLEEFFGLKGIKPNKPRDPPPYHYAISEAESALMNGAAANDNIPVVQAQAL